jgi:MFS family permease
MSHSPSNAASVRNRWQIVVMMMFYAAIGHFNRTGIRRAGNDIFIEEMGMTPDQMGDVISAFLWVYTCCMLPGGWLIDRIGAARALTLFGVGMGTCVALTGAWGWFSMPITTFYVGLLLIRGCAGFFNVPLHPGAAQIVSHSFPMSLRTMANGMVTAGAVLGIVVSYPLYGMLIRSLTWTWAFIVAGGAMVAFGLFWSALSRDVNFRAQRIEEGGDDRTAAASRLGGLSVVRNPQLWLVTLSYACYSYYQYLLFYWMEYYLKTSLKFDAAQIDRTSVLVNLAMAVGMVIGGLMNARLCFLLGDTVGRRGIVITGMTFSGAAGLIGLAFSDPVSVTCCFALSTALLGTTEGVFWTAATESGGVYRGVAAALMNTGGNAGGSISPQISPRIADVIDWNGAFAVACGICALGGVMWLWIKPSPEPHVPPSA